MRVWLVAIIASVLVAWVPGCGHHDDGVKPHYTAPTASFVVAPDSGTTQTVFQFDASGSSDVEDPVESLQVRWDWEDDGTWDVDYSTAKTAQHRYATTGTKTILLQVKDTEEQTGTASRTVVIDAGPPPGFVLVQPGASTMGSPFGELCRDSDETQHQVTLTHAFYVSTAEVTQAQWLATMGWDESSFDGPDRPVEQVTWFDAVSYCNLRSTAEALTPVYAIAGAVYDGNHITSAEVTWNQDANGYRLLTEAEWECASRAGSTSAICDGGINQCDCGSGSEPDLDAVAWYCGNADAQTHDVATKSPNAWGIHDMHGNVWEWCWDVYGDYAGDATDPAGPASGSDRVSRGGGWNDYAPGCRSANRSYSNPGGRIGFLGLRLAMAAS